MDTRGSSVQSTHFLPQVLESWWVRDGAASRRLQRRDSNRVSMVYGDEHKERAYLEQRIIKSLSRGDWIRRSKVRREIKRRAWQKLCFCFCFYLADFPKDWNQKEWIISHCLSFLHLSGFLLTLNILFSYN